MLEVNAWLVLEEDGEDEEGDLELGGGDKKEKFGVVLYCELIF